MTGQPRRHRYGGALLLVALGLVLLFGGPAAYQNYQSLFATRQNVNPDSPNSAPGQPPLPKATATETDPRLGPELIASEILGEGDQPPTRAWPQWRGPRHDGIAFGQNLLTAWPAGGPPRRWEVPGGQGYSCFALGGGRLFTCLREEGKEVVVCLHPDSGKEVWRLAYDCTYQNGYGNGPRATPTLSGGRLYTVGAAGHLHCLDAATGKELWKHDLLAEFQAKNLGWGVSFSPLVEGDLVITNPGGPNGNSVAAFHKVSGELVWKAGDDPAGYSSPVAITVAGVRQVVVFVGKSLMGFRADNGRVLWRFPWDTQFQVHAATPIPFKARKGDQVFDYVFISTGYSKGCALVKIEPEGAGNFRALRVYQGTQLCSHFGSPVRYKEHIYGFNEFALTCLEVKSGAVKWTQNGFQKGTLLAADGHLIVLGENGNLALGEASPEGFQKKAEFKVLGARSWTMPVLADGYLYLRDEEKMLCLDVARR